MTAPSGLSRTLLKGGRIIDPGSNLDATGDVLIDRGRIAAIDTKPGRLTADGATRVVDAEGLIVCPGLIDLHVHLREPDPNHRETLATGAAAAINGGFTTVCCMPNTQPPLDSPMMMHLVAQRAAKARQARVYAVGCATAQRAGERMAPIAAMAEAGAVGFSDDGAVIASAGMMRRVLAAAKAVDRTVFQHCQEPSLTKGGVMNAGVLAARLGLTGWPSIAEEMIIERDIELNRSIGCRYHAQHVSAAGSVELIRSARKAGQPVSGEASPHHLLLTEDACANYDTNAKMNPPLRTKRDIEALKTGIADGTITVLATDHAPHPLESKENDFESASFGIVGLDCALPLYVQALIDDNVLDWPRLIAMMTCNSAELVGLNALGLGALRGGMVDVPADITVIDPELAWTIDPSEFNSAGRNCPFAGWDVRGRAVMTIVAGEVRMDRVAARAMA